MKKVIAGVVLVTVGVGIGMALGAGAARAQAIGTFMDTSAMLSTGPATPQFISGYVAGASDMLDSAMSYQTTMGNTWSKASRSVWTRKGPTSAN